MKKQLNPAIIQALKESDNDPNAYSISLDQHNCRDVMRMMALQHSAKKLTQNDRNQEDSKRQTPPRLLSA